MNAPATPAALAEPILQLIAVEKLQSSPTHIQALRRARFDPKALDDLAASIRQVGVLQPIVAKPFKKSPLLNPVDSDPTHIIVAGERRWLAAKRAGLATVPVSVRELTDEQVLEVQLIENLQREGLHELEEAEGYEELMKLKKINAEAVADMVGKSRSYVYARTKLLALCPEARTAFYAGEIDASKALLVARIGHHDTQRAALKDLAGDSWNGPLSYREAHRHIVQNYMLKLKAAPFATDDVTLLPKAGTCAACPKRTGNQRDLFADVKDADICTDPKCFDDKRTAHFERKRLAAEKAGKKVITGKEAAAVFPSKYSRNEVGGGFVSLDSTAWDHPKQLKVREIVTKTPGVVELVQHPDTKALVEVVRSSALTEILNERGIKTQRQRAAESQAKARKKNGGEKFDAELQTTIGCRIALAIYKACPPKIGKPELMRLFGRLVESYEFEYHDALGAILGMPAIPADKPGYAEHHYMKKLEALGEADLARAFNAIHLVEEEHTKNGAAVLKRLKVDPKAIEKAVRAEAAKAAKEEAPQVRTKKPSKPAKK